MSRCRETKANGELCTLPASGPQGLCWAHDPANRAQRSRMASRAARSKGNKEVTILKEEIKALIADVRSGELDRNDAAVMVHTGSLKTSSPSSATSRRPTSWPPT
jgi:hypothetical protein